MTRVAQTEILCVYCPEEFRAHVSSQLSNLHPNAVHTKHRLGWLVVESPLGEPYSRYLGSTADVRLLLGEEQLIGDSADAVHLDRLATQVLTAPDTLARLPGDFSLVVLASAGRAAAVRSCSGNPRLFGFCCQGITAMSTRLDWLARLYPKELAFDRLRIAIEFSGLAAAPNFGSVLQGISIVPCGHVAHWGTGESPRVTRYWSLPTAIEHFSAPEIAETIAHELRAELRRHIDPAGNTAVLLSGGLDSSLLFGLATRETQFLDAVTTLPPQEHADFERERYFSRLAATGCRQQSVFTLSPSSVVSHLRASPGDLCPLSTEWFGLGRLEHRPDVIVSGWFADECWGFLRLCECLKTWLPNVPRLAVHAPFKRELFRFWFDRHRSGRFTFPPANVSYPQVLEPTLAGQFKGWLANCAWLPRPEQTAERLHLHRWLTDMGGHYAEAAAYIGARAITPFTSRALVELAARCDPHALFHRGLSKEPLRVLARRVLPPPLAARTDKGDWSPSLDVADISPPKTAGIQALLDTQYLADHPSLSLDDVWAIEWLNVLERGRLRAEHERKTIWR